MELLAYRQIRSATGRKARGGGGPITEEGLRWALTAPATLADLGEMWTAAHPPPKAPAGADPLEALVSRTSNPDVARELFGGSGG